MLHIGITVNCVCMVNVEQRRAACINLGLFDTGEANKFIYMIETTFRIHSRPMHTFLIVFRLFLMKMTCL